jgi:hypothetical protein
LKEAFARRDVANEQESRHEHEWRPRTTHRLS